MPPESKRFGLSEEDLLTISAVLKKHPQIDRGVIFGSRAMGNFKPGSDIDIALYGTDLDSPITHILYELNQESLLPYYFDILAYEEITHPELKDHIDRVGVPFYSKPI